MPAPNDHKIIQLCAEKFYPKADAKTFSEGSETFIRFCLVKANNLKNKIKNNKKKLHLKEKALEDDRSGELSGP